MPTKIEKPMRRWMLMTRIDGARALVSQDVSPDVFGHATIADSVKGADAAGRPAAAHVHDAPLTLCVNGEEVGSEGGPTAIRFPVTVRLSAMSITAIAKSCLEIYVSPFRSTSVSWFPSRNRPVYSPRSQSNRYLPTSRSSRNPSNAVRLHREPVALGHSVPLRAWWERIHDAYTISVVRHTAADLYDIRGRVAEPGCRFDVGRRSSKRHCLLRRVARPDAADGNHDDSAPRTVATMESGSVASPGAAVKRALSTLRLSGLRETPMTS